VVGVWGDLDDGDRLGRGWKLEGENVGALVYRTGLPARFDDYEKATGLIGASARKAGLSSAVGGPIFVNGRLWGELEAATSRPGPMPADAELRI
jgi:hypothetical protein